MGGTDEREEPRHHHVVHCTCDNVRKVLQSEKEELGNIFNVPLRIVSKERSGRGRQRWRGG